MGVPFFWLVVSGGGLRGCSRRAAGVNTTALGLFRVSRAKKKKRMKNGRQQKSMLSGSITCLCTVCYVIDAHLRSSSANTLVTSSCTYFICLYVLSRFVLLFVCMYVRIFSGRRLHLFCMVGIPYFVQRAPRLGSVATISAQRLVPYSHSRVLVFIPSIVGVVFHFAMCLRTFFRPEDTWMWFDGWSTPPARTRTGPTMTAARPFSSPARRVTWGWRSGSSARRERR